MRTDQHKSTRPRRWIVVGLLSTILVPSACASNPVSDAIEQVASRYPAAVRSEFLSNCAATSGGNVSACECSLEKIEATVSLEDFVALDAAVNATGTVPPSLEAILLSCA